MTIENLPPSAIPLDSGTQVRADMDVQAVSEYAEAYRQGEDIPPPICFREGDKLYLGSGFHRILAAKEAKLRTLPVEVRPGGMADAIECGIQENMCQRGVRWRLRDKKRAATMLIGIHPEWSDTKVGEACRLYRETVSQIRTSTCGQPQVLSDDIDVDAAKKCVRIGRDNKPRNVHVQLYGREMAEARAKLRMEDAEPLEPPPPDPAAPPQDAIGNVLNCEEHARAFGPAKDEIETMIGHIRIIRKRVKALHAAREPIIREVSEQAVEMQTDNLLLLLRHGLPHALCPVCGGSAAGCEVCFRRGWLSKFRYESLPRKQVAYEPPPKLL